MGSGAFGNVTVIGSTLGGLLSANNLSDVANTTTSLNNLLPSQTGNNGKAIVTNGTNASWQTVSGAATWGSITGTLSSQTDLNNRFVQTDYQSVLNSLTLGG